MFDELPLEVLARIGTLGKWDSETFLALSHVSKKYRQMLQGLRLYAERFNLGSVENEMEADMASTETIVRQWFTNWRTCNPQVVQRVGLLEKEYCKRDC